MGSMNNNEERLVTLEEEIAYWQSALGLIPSEMPRVDLRPEEDEDDE